MVARSSNSDSAVPIALAMPVTPPSLSAMKHSPPTPDTSTSYLQVLTPAIKSNTGSCMMVELQLDDMDDPVAGVQHFAWGTSLSEWSFRSRYDWLAWLLPCVVVPQIELRMGVTSSFWLASISYLLAQIVAFAMAGCVVMSVLDNTLYQSTDVEEESSGSRELAGLWMLLLITFLLLQVYCLARNLAVLRARVRERLSIPGTYRDDLHAALLRPTGVIRQLGRQLQCHEQPIPCSCRAAPIPDPEEHEFVMSGHV